MRTLFIFDIDSTVADNDHRVALLCRRCDVCLFSPMPTGHHASCPSCSATSSTHTQASWDAFLDPDAVAKDTPIPGAIRVLSKLRAMGAKIVFLTGRNEPVLGDVTKAWLKNHAGWLPESEPLFMRLSGEEGLPASVYKERALQRLKSSLEEEHMLIFFEDDPHVFNLYNKHGLCIRCPEAWEWFCPAGVRGAEPALSR